MAKSITVIFNGIAFRCYPNSTHRTHRCYYGPHARHRMRGVGFLHQEVWKSVHGPIPRGHHIHHIDENTHNNAPDNLECVTPKEHSKRHQALLRRLASLPAGKARMARLQRLAASTPRSPAFRASASLRFRRAWVGRLGVSKQCAFCGAAFMDRSMQQSGYFCHANCKMRWRHAARVDFEKRSCAACGSSFECNKHFKTRCCSKKCAQRLRRLSRASGTG